MREEMSFDTFFPFIEHFIKFCIDLTLWDAKMRLEIDVKYKQKIDPNFSLNDQKKKMLTYKNSLLIMKHFNGLK